MADENELLKKRYIELSERALGYYTYTDFLALAEQSLFCEVKSKIKVPYCEFGGAAGCERVVVRFGDEALIGYDGGFPITVIEICPKDKKYAEKLTHRDYLGALTSLGITRDVLGDIVVKEDKCYLFCLDGISEYIEKELTRVRNTYVICKRTDEVPEGELYTCESVRVQVSSERLDAVIAKLYRLSREDAQALFKKGLVFVSGKEIRSVSYTPKPDDKISVRGRGRFIYRGFVSESKKGKLNIELSVYK